MTRKAEKPLDCRVDLSQKHNIKSVNGKDKHVLSNTKKKQKKKKQKRLITLKEKKGINAGG